MTNKPPIIPQGIPGNLLGYLRSLSLYVQMALQRRSEDTSSRDSLLLSSPDGSVWEIRVDDTGDITATKVAG